MRPGEVPQLPRATDCFARGTITSFLAQAGGSNGLPTLQETRRPQQFQAHLAGLHSSKRVRALLAFISAGDF